LVRHDLLQTSILILELFEPLRFGDTHAGVLLSPRIERRIAHPVLAGQVGDRHALLGFFQDADDLGLGVSLALHGSLQGAGNSSIAWTEIPISGQGGLRHFIGFRGGDEHVARLQALQEASGFTRGEILRRTLLNAKIPSPRTRQEVQDLLRIQRQQNRLGGFLKKALTEREEKAALRRTLIEVERNAAELRRVLAHLVRSR